MKNNFAEEYARDMAIHNAYDAARDANDEAGKEKARADHKEFDNDLMQKGNSYCRLYDLYKLARDAGNEYIDFSDVIWDKDVPTKIESLRELGIEKFTFSSTWSSAVETAWLFLQNGCTLEGLIQINSRFNKFMSEERERIPAYLFAVN